MFKKKTFLVKVVCICLKYQNPNRQPDHSTFTIYHNMLILEEKVASEIFFMCMNKMNVISYSCLISESNSVSVWCTRCWHWGISPWHCCLSNFMKFKSHVKLDIIAERGDHRDDINISFQSDTIPVDGRQTPFSSRSPHSFIGPAPGELEGGRNWL